MLLLLLGAAASFDPGAAAVTGLADRYVAARVAQDPGLADQLNLPVPERLRSRLPDQRPASIRKLEREVDRIGASLARIDRRGLSGEPRVLHALLTEEVANQQGMRVCRKEYWDVSHYESWLAYLRRTAEAARVDTPARRTAALTRWRAFPTYVEREIANLEVGLAAGYSVPRPVVDRVATMVAQIAAETPDSSPFYAPARRTDDARFAADMRAVVAEAINPALERYRKFLVESYGPRARASMGVSALPDGARCYRALIRSFTSLPLSPKELMERARRERAAALKRATILGERRYGTRDLPAVLAKLDAEPGESFTSEAEMLSAARERTADLERRTRPMFRQWPVQKVVVEPYPPFMRGSGVAFKYDRSFDPASPGVFRVPAERFATTPRSRLLVVAAHEAVPGHHLSQSQLVNRPAHPLRRLFWSWAYEEGWASYAELLAEEAGLTRPDTFLLDLDLRNTGRGMMIDIGVNAFGWGGAQIADPGVTVGEKRPVEQVALGAHRAMAFPGSLLPYEIGEAEILSLRRRAEAALGPRFDLRDFHHVVLADGQVPLWFLREKVEEWIGNGGGADRPGH
jgi:uncharacterized protein (DUF885 family)